MTVATAANRLAKWLILLVGGPGRTRTSNQTVMSGLLDPEISTRTKRKAIANIQ